MRFASVLLIAALALPALAQQPASPSAAPPKPQPEFRSHAQWPVPAAADTSTPRGTALAFFQAISAPKGGALDRQRLRSLFVPDGRIEVPLAGGPQKPTDVIFLTPEQYAESSDQQTANAGFFDHLLAARVQQFGAIAHVWTAYESRQNLNDPQPFVRGIKAFELLHRDGHWYITQVSWDWESKDQPIPDAYLKDQAD